MNWERKKRIPAYHRGIITCVAHSRRTISTHARYCLVAVLELSSILAFVVTLWISFSPSPLSSVFSERMRLVPPLFCTERGQEALLLFIYICRGYKAAMLIYLINCAARRFFRFPTCCRTYSQIASPLVAPAFLASYSSSLDAAIALFVFAFFYACAIFCSIANPAELAVRYPSIAIWDKHN